MFFDKNRYEEWRFIFVEKKIILPSGEAGYLKTENTGQNMNVTKRVVEGL